MPNSFKNTEKHTIVVANLPSTMFENIKDTAFLFKINCTDVMKIAYKYFHEEIHGIRRTPPLKGD